MQITFISRHVWVLMRLHSWVKEMLVFLRKCIVINGGGVIYPNIQSNRAMKN